MIESVAVDMDGVLSNFIKRFRELYDDIPLTDYHDSNEIKRKIHRERFHDFVINNNFATLEPLPDFKLGMEFLSGLSIPVYILSSTATDEYLEEASKQKRSWLNKHYVPYESYFVPGKRYKCTYAKPNTIIIDDTESVIKDWNNAGGIGIHHVNWEETINSLNKLI